MRTKREVEENAQKLRERRAAKRAMIQGIKVRAGCAECGENHPAVLQFHHLDPAKKETNVQRMVASNRSVAQILAEIAKCSVLCANCHAIFHWRERNAAPPSSSTNLEDNAP